MRRSAVTDRPTRSARSIAYRLVGLQAVVVVVVSVLWAFGSFKHSLSALLGGLACVIPSLYFAKRLFATTSAQAPKKLLKAFYLGELFKLALSIGLVAIIILFLPVSLLPFMTGFISAQFGFWLAPFMGNLLSGE